MNRPSEDGRSLLYSHIGCDNFADEHSVGVVVRIKACGDIRRQVGGIQIGGKTLPANENELCLLKAGSALQRNRMQSGLRELVAVPAGMRTCNAERLALLLPEKAQGNAFLFYNTCGRCHP